MYHQIAVGRGKFRDRRVYSRKVGGSPYCRRGCNVIETVQHVFFECPHYFNDTINMRNICRRKRIYYDMKTLFTHPSLSARVEMFLGKVIPENDFFSF